MELGTNGIWIPHVMCVNWDHSCHKFQYVLKGLPWGRCVTLPYDFTSSISYKFQAYTFGMIGTWLTWWCLVPYGSEYSDTLFCTVSSSLVQITNCSLMYMYLCLRKLSIVIGHYLELVPVYLLLVTIYCLYLVLPSFVYVLRLYYLNELCFFLSAYHLFSVCTQGVIYVLGPGWKLRRCDYGNILLIILFLVICQPAGSVLDDDFSGDSDFWIDSSDWDKLSVGSPLGRGSSTSMTWAQVVMMSPSCTNQPITMTSPNDELPLTSPRPSLNQMSMSSPTKLSWSPMVLDSPPSSTSGISGTNAN